MTIFGKPLRDYVAFVKIFLILIPAVGLLRLALSLSGAPNTTARWLSMTVMVWIAVIYSAVRVHTTGFGSYKQLLVLCFLLNGSSQIVSIFGILLSIATQTPNVYSSPEFAFGSDNNWGHVAAHVLIGTPVGSLVGWLGGSAFLAATRKLSPRRIVGTRA